MSAPSPLPERDAGSAERRSFIRRVGWWLQLVVVLAMLVGLVVIAEPARLWRALAGADGRWALVALPLAFAGICFDALRLYLLMKPHGFRGGWGTVLRTNLVVNFASLFLPGTVGGGAVTWFRLSKPDQLRAQTFAALSLNSVLKTVVLAGAGALALALDARAGGAHRSMAVPLLAAAALPVVVLFLMLWTGALSLVKRFHVKFLHRFMPSRIHDALRKVIESFETYRDSRPSVLAALGASVCRKLLENVVCLLALYAVGVGGEVGFVRVLWITCAVELASMAPFTFSGLGLPQVTFVVLLSAFGIGRDVSLAAQVIILAVTMPVYLSGAAILMSESVAKRR